MSACVRLLCFLLIHAIAGIAWAAGQDSAIIARAGSLPILLTAPHGGWESVPGVTPRSRGTTLTDTHTIELMEALAKHLESNLGAKPYVVAARFSRKFIDANRPEGEAFDLPEAKPAYEAYHNQIRLFISQIKERFPRGALLLDIHGQSSDPDVVHRGTRDGETVSALLRGRGPEALIGPNSILGVVHGKGYKVFPPNTPPGNPPEDRRFRGGYTVHTYGSAQPDGIDALQIEVGSHVRTNARFIAALGEAIATFYTTHLASDRPPR